MDSSKLVIFDFDGTIADTLEAAILVLKEFAREGIIQQFTDEDIARWKKMSPRDIIKEVNMPWWKMMYLVFIARRRLKKHLDDVTLFEGMQVAITDISRSYPCVVISSNTKSSVDYILNKFNITEFKETHGGGSLLGKYKKINKILRQYNVLPEHAVLITDEARDIDSAKISGIKSIAVTWGYQDSSILQKHTPEKIVSTPQELSQTVHKVLKN
jgi:phosphoglycolate phosphatase